MTGEPRKIGAVKSHDDGDRDNPIVCLGDRGLLLLRILSYLFGPGPLRTGELVVIGLLIFGLVWFRVWLRQRGA
jgi:hypothetical protein